MVHAYLSNTKTTDMDISNAQNTQGSYQLFCANFWKTENIVPLIVKKTKLYNWKSHSDKYLIIYCFYFLMGFSLRPVLTTYYVFWLWLINAQFLTRYRYIFSRECKGVLGTPPDNSNFIFGYSNQFRNKRLFQKCSIWVPLTHPNTLTHYPDINEAVVHRKLYLNKMTKRNYKNCVGDVFTKVNNAYFC